MNRRQLLTRLSAAGMAACLPALAADQIKPLRVGLSPRALGAACNDFAFDLHRQEAVNNLFISPFSIHAALSMTSAGALGKTQGEMLDTLNVRASSDSLGTAWGKLMAELTDGKDPSYELTIANRLFAQRGMRLSPQFAAITRRSYAAPVESVDYAASPDRARQRVNTWVEDHTNQRIKDLIPPNLFTPDTRLTLVNAIWFLGKWAVAFDERRTHAAAFTKADGTKADCKLMVRKSPIGHRRLSGADVVTLPYGKTGRLQFVAVVPNRPSDLDTILKDTNAQTLRGWTSGITRKKITLFLPKFTGGSKLKLKPTLSKMGMPTAFTNQADFRAITRDEQLKIANVIHQSYVDVSEKGTEAAAATAVVMTRKGAARPVPVVRADRPFFYAIQDTQTGALLFTGRLDDPTA